MSEEEDLAVIAPTAVIFPEAVIEATPVRLPLTFAVPLKLCPQMVRVLVSLVAVDAELALPDSEPLKVVLVMELNPVIVEGKYIFTLPDPLTE